MRRKLLSRGHGWSLQSLSKKLGPKTRRRHHIIRGRNAAERHPVLVAAWWQARYPATSRLSCIHYHPQSFEILHSYPSFVANSQQTTPASATATHLEQNPRFPISHIMLAQMIPFSTSMSNEARRIKSGASPVFHANCTRRVDVRHDQDCSPRR